MLNEEALLPLLKARKKKYIKKLLEYAIAIPSPHCIPNLLSTPISQQCQTDLQLTTQQTQALISTLTHLIDLSLSHPFQNIFSTQFDGSLKECLTDLLLSLRKDIIQTKTNHLNNRLIDFQWSVDLQVADHKGKCNRPIVRLQLTGNKKKCNLQLSKQAFDGFYDALRTIKDKISGK